ncbi:MAG: aldo/keto reductase [Eubacteriales bacterium]|nr:aldo/keto reductase [Eubacteriales bacterium]
MPSIIPTVTLHNGVEVPVLSIGTYKVQDLDGVIGAALDAGFTAIDAAEHYGNEAAVGEAISRLRQPRSKLYLSTKIWNTDHGYRRTLEAFKESAARLRTRPDMLLIHWPCPMKGLYQETWSALQHLYAQGQVAAIGVSNFTSAHLRTLEAMGGVQPMVNQVEMHPFYIDEQLLAYCREHHIIVEAWSPLLRGTAVISHPVIRTMAEKYQCSPAQLAVRYLTQYGVRVIIRSSNPAHIAENADIFRLKITDDDFESLKELNTHKRYFQDPDEYYL